MTYQKPTCGRCLLQRLDTTHGLRGDGPTPVAKVKVRSRLAPRPQIVDLSGVPKHTNHEAGSGRPSPRRS